MYPPWNYKLYTHTKKWSHLNILALLKKKNSATSIIIKMIIKSGQKVL